MLFIPGDRTKVLHVDIYIERWGTMENLSMRNKTGSNLWEGSIIVSCLQPLTRYYFMIEVDSSFYLNLGFLGKCRIHEKSKVSKTIVFQCRRESSLEIQLAFCDKTGKEEGYFSLCYNILKSAKSGNELECMTQMAQMKDISDFLNEKQRNAILLRMIKVVQTEKLTKSINCALFVSFLLHAHRSLQLMDMIQNQFAKIIMNGFSSMNVGYIPKAQLDAFIDMLKMVYRCADGEDANYFSFCNCMYPCFGAVFCLEFLSCSKRSQKEFDYLMPKSDARAIHILQSLVDKICGQWGSFKEEQLLCKIQQLLSLKMQTKLIEFSSNIVDVPATTTDILQSACKKKLQEISTKGELVDIITEWYEISNCIFLDTDEIRDLTEKCLLKCIDKAKKYKVEKSYDKLKDMCLFGKLFMGDSKGQLLRTFVTSIDERFHSFVPLFLKTERYQNIPRNDLDNIVLNWFDHALDHFCKYTSNENDLPGLLHKVYAYVAEIMGIACLQSHDRLSAQLRRKAFEYLKDIDIVEVVKVVPYMERLDCRLIEDLFRDHIKTLFNEALENQDISKHDLFCHTKTCAVNQK